MSVTVPTSSDIGRPSHTHRDEPFSVLTADADPRSPTGTDEGIDAPESVFQDRAISKGYPFWPCAEPLESEVAAIREKLPLVSAAEASVLGNRELFGRLATRAMLPGTVQLFERWRPQLVLREPASTPRPWPRRAAARLSPKWPSPSPT
jgi:hypothetical protein